MMEHKLYFDADAKIDDFLGKYFLLICCKKDCAICDKWEKEIGKVDELSVKLAKKRVTGFYTTDLKTTTALQKIVKAFDAPNWNGEKESYSVPWIAYVKLSKKGTKYVVEDCKGKFAVTAATKKTCEEIISWLVSIK